MGMVLVDGAGWNTTLLARAAARLVLCRLHLAEQRPFESPYE